MPRHQRPAELSLQSNNVPENGVQPGPNSSPINLQGVDLGSFGGGFEHDVASSLTMLPPLPQSPPVSPRVAQKRDPSKSILSNFKSRISPDTDQKQKKDPRQGSYEDGDYRPGTSGMSKIYHLRKNPGSTPELSLVGSNENVHRDAPDGDKPGAQSARPLPTSQRSENSTISSKPKRPFGRTKSTRQDSDSKSRPRTDGTTFDETPPKTAPLRSDWPGAESRRMDLGTGKDKDKRGKSAERAIASESEETLVSTKSDKIKGSSLHIRGQKLTKGIKSGSTTIFNRLGKIGRSTSNNEREVSDTDYKIKIIDKPLIDQTRVTRISKQLSGCRDKTEYWMPSLPWRCIDYLNTHCEEEGLYRVPGSGPRVKHWQRRFDTELDIDLLSEDVGDTNEIASMLKAWLRELPTEVMPLALQHDLATQLENENPQYRNVGQPASQLLRDALSELPPFNYYLLFAVTCHLSLLLTNKEKNKMDLNNLAICVGPCLNMERWLFNYLVGDWRHCWQGCYTEKEFLKAEEAHERGEVYSQSGSDVNDEQSLSSTLHASTIDDGASEAVSLQSNPEERTLSSGSGSVVSRPIGGFNDASLSRESEQRKNENFPPTTYMPAGATSFTNGNVRLGIDQELKRPHTADQRFTPDESIRGALPSITTDSPSGTKTMSASSTPRVGHNRSRSDIPLTPVKTNTADFGTSISPPS